MMKRTAYFPSGFEDDSLEWHIGQKDSNGKPRTGEKGAHSVRNGAKSSQNADAKVLFLIQAKQNTMVKFPPCHFIQKSVKNAGRI